MRLIKLILALIFPVKNHYKPLNDDVLIEILLRLPLKSLTRFQSVSKSWRSLISTDDYFCRLYKPPRSLILTTIEISPHITNPNEFFYHNQFSLYPPSEKITPFDIHGVENVHILNCSHGGLMLLKEWYDNKYYVYNPTTKHLVQQHCHADVSMLYLVFDPYVSPHYKIVCSSEKEVEGGYIVVFSSEKGTWRRVHGFGGGAGITNVVQCRSFIYFINNGFLHCFDIVENDSRLIIVGRLPSEATTYSHVLRESRGRLYLCSLFSDEGDVSAGLWELQGGSKWWLLKYVNRIVHLHQPLRMKVMTFVAETSTILIEAPGKIVAYSFLDRSYKVLLHLEQTLASWVDVM